MDLDLWDYFGRNSQKKKKVDQKVTMPSEKKQFLWIVLFEICAQSYEEKFLALPYDFLQMALFFLLVNAE